MDHSKKTDVQLSQKNDKNSFWHCAVFGMGHVKFKLIIKVNKIKIMFG